MSDGDAAIRWSDAVNALNAWKKKQDARLEADRLRALSGLPEAAQAMNAWRTGLAEATRDREKAIALAGATETEALFTAMAARAEAFERADTDYRAAEGDAYDKRNEQEQEARLKYEEEVGAARDARGTGPVYLRKREEARGKRDRAIAAANRRLESARKRLHKARHKAVGAAQRAEIRAIESAGAARKRAVVAAEKAFAQARSRLDRAFRAKTASVPAATAIEAEHREKKTALEAEFKRRENEILERLRAELSS